MGLEVDLFFAFCYVTPYEAALSNYLYLTIKKSKQAVIIRKQ